MEVFLAILIFFVTAIFGAALGSLTYLIIEHHATTSPTTNLLPVVGGVLALMLGNGSAVTAGPFFLGFLDLPPDFKILNPALVKALFILGYLFGFGSGFICMLLIKWKRDPFKSGIADLLNNRQLQALVLLYSFGMKDLEAAAGLMRISVDEFNEISATALRELKKHHSGLIKSHKERNGQNGRPK